MPRHPDFPDSVRPNTAVLTLGFDPSLSVGSARCAVFRSSTYVFSTPEAAERAFDIMGGRSGVTQGEKIDLVYSRFSHPNAEILEDQIVPLETGASSAAVFNSGMAAIMSAFFTFSRADSSVVYTSPLYGGATTLIHQFLSPLGVTGIPAPAGNSAALDDAIRSAKNPCIVMVETPANPTMIMTDIRRAAEAAARHPSRPVVMVDNTFLGPIFQHPLALGADLCLYSATKYLSGFSDMIAGVAIAKDPQIDSEDSQPRQPGQQHPAAGRMLDARHASSHRGAAHEPPKQECPTHCRTPGGASSDQTRYLPHAILGCRAEPHPPRAVRLSWRGVLPQFPRRP